MGLIRELKRRIWLVVAVMAVILSLTVGYVTAQQSYYASLLEMSTAQHQADLTCRKLKRESKRIAAKDAKVAAKTARWLTSIRASTEAIQQPESDWVESQPTKPAATRDHFHWAFSPLRKVEVPETDPADGQARNGIDRFIIRGLVDQDVGLQATADNHVLARRFWLGLTGLPPSAQDLQETEQLSQTGLDLLVAELLERDGYGEHWGQYWLDLVQYADSNGYEEDEIRPHAYPFRDFAIWAFNQDLPFDQFLRWQIAGDEINVHNPMAVAATGFLTAPPYNTFIPQESERYDELDNIVSTVGSAMLGVSVGCARCHDHPYDEITIDEYYSMVAIFKPTRREIRYLVPDTGDAFNAVAGEIDEFREEIRQMRLARVKEDRIADLEDFTEEEKDILRLPLDPNNKEQIRLLSLCRRCLMFDDTFIDEKTKPLPKDKERFDYLMSEIENRSPTLPPRPPQGLTIAGSEIGESPVLHGGSLSNQDGVVGPGFIDQLTAVDEEGNPLDWKHWDPSKPRTALAKWITDVDQGAGAVAARVAVNRIWQYHFGRGLVDTPSNLGTEGGEPSHPDLLEWLAGEFVDSGWSVKHIHRLILCSATYRQARLTGETPSEQDRKLYRGHRPTRLTAEMFRDSLLQIGGRLNRRMYGPPYQPPIPREGIMNRDKENPDKTWPTNVINRPEVRRRSIYAMRRRTNPIPMFQLFDSPCGLFSCPQRRDTIVPTQALALWNDQFVRQQSYWIATRILADTNQDQPAAVQQLFRETLGRHPDSHELARATAFLQRPDTKLEDLTQVLLMSNEFWYVN